MENFTADELIVLQELKDNYRIENAKRRYDSVHQYTELTTELTFETYYILQETNFDKLHFIFDFLGIYYYTDNGYELGECHKEFYYNELNILFTSRNIKYSEPRNIMTVKYSSEHAPEEYEKDLENILKIFDFLLISNEYIIK